MGPRQSKNGCCGDRPLSNLGAAIGIPCYFKPKSEGSNLSQNNMGSLWEPLNWTLVGHHNINFLIAQDPYEDNLKRKSILFAGLLKLKFWLLGRSTIDKIKSTIHFNLRERSLFTAGGGGANPKIACTKNLPPLGTRALRFCPPSDPAH